MALEILISQIFDFNGVGDLERGYGYLIKVTEEINNFNICE